MSDEKSIPLGWQWVAAQLVLFAAIFFAGLLLHGDAPSALVTIIGGALLLVGLACVGLSILQLGSNLSIFPRPVEGGSLVQNGLYGLARHPIYSGIIIGALGYSLLLWSGAAALLTLLLALFFDRKSAQEEIWLSQRFPEYTAYQRRVRKLFPGLY